jgi:hypothetical protein
VWTKETESSAVKRYWELIADNLHDVGWSLGWVSAIDSQGRTIWIVDAHRGDGKRFIVRADEKLSAFVELERAVLTVTFYSRINACQFESVSATLYLTAPDQHRFSPLLSAKVVFGS